MGSTSGTHGAPNWDEMTLELRCPRCGYNLRLLTVARCPECGLQFAWDDIVAAAEQRLESPLFEYQWRRRPVRALFRTIATALRPRRLWSQANLAVEPRVGALLLMALLVLALCAVGHLVVILGYWWRVYGSPPWPFLSSWDPVGWLLLVWGSVAVVGVSLWMFLQVFGQTYGRARVRPTHLLRVVVLAWATLIVWKWLLWCAIVLAMIIWSLRNTPYGYPVLAVCDLASLALGVYSLCLGFTVYLKLRRGWVEVLVGVGLTALFWATFVLAISTLVYDSLRNPVVEVAAESWPGLAWIIDALLKG